MAEKKLYRSYKNRMVAGVFGGVGKYFGIDANILRILFVIIDISTGFIPCIIIYAACALILPVEPQKPSETTVDVTSSGTNSN